jgi:flavin reductase (DIM6/NTAB) family NADH-FMN oxidoreductase RutF
MLLILYLILIINKFLLYVYFKKGGIIMKREKIESVNRLINHGPLVVVSATYEDKTTFTPVAWNMPVAHSPALVGITVGKKNYLNTLIKSSKNFCLNILSIQETDLIVGLGSCSGRDTDKINKFGLKISKCKTIDTYYLENSLAHIETVLIKDVDIENLVNIFVGRADYAEAVEGSFSEVWNLDKVKPVHHLGGNNFCYAVK